MEFLSNIKSKDPGIANKVSVINFCYYFSYTKAYDLYFNNDKLLNDIPLKGIHFGMQWLKLIWRTGLPSSIAYVDINGRRVKRLIYNRRIGGVELAVELYLSNAGLYFYRLQFSNRGIDLEYVLDILLTQACTPDQRQNMINKIQRTLQVQNTASLCTNAIFMLISRDADHFGVNLLNFTLDKEGFLF